MTLRHEVAAARAAEHSDARAEREIGPVLDQIRQINARARAGEITEKQRRKYHAQLGVQLAGPPSVGQANAKRVSLIELRQTQLHDKMDGTDASPNCWEDAG